jgi:hypothetical protein
MGIHSNIDIMQRQPLLQKLTGLEPIQRNQVAIIRTEFDANINSYMVTFPSFVTLEALQIWGAAFSVELGRQSGLSDLLLDTNTHDFESIECLKWLNDFFRKELNIAATIRRVAFVQPKKYRNPEIINASVAYFEKVKDAREWLKRVHI